MPQVLRSVLAEADLDEVWLHVALDNPDAADALLTRIAARCEMLAGNPGAGRLRPEIGARVRSFPVGSYLLFYRPCPEGMELTRVIHAARDLGSLVSGIREPRIEYRVAA